MQLSPCIFRGTGIVAVSAACMLAQSYQAWAAKPIVLPDYRFEVPKVSLVTNGAVNLLGKVDPFAQAVPARKLGLPEVEYSAVVWSRPRWDTLSPEDIQSLEIVPAVAVDERLEVHEPGREMQVVHRVIAKTTNGGIFVSRPLVPRAIELDSRYYLPLTLIEFSSEQARATPHGSLTIPEYEDPTDIATSGFVLNAQVAGGGARAQIVVPPRFLNRMALGLDGAPGVDGEAGDPGVSGEAGQPGSNGSDGNPGKLGRAGADMSAGDDGGEGTSGKNGKPGKDGRSGKDGKEGRDGGAGADAGELQVRISQLDSPFFEKPLARVVIARGDESSVSVVEWGQAFTVHGRGGAGGKGGDGGRGGDGGAGGAGGAGGKGGDGGAGGQGGRGEKGQDGDDAVCMSSYAKNGWPGAKGEHGGNGGSGGIGGDGADGGIGGASGNGGNGRNGGPGGRGGTMHVVVEGSTEFLRMIDQYFTFDVTGGAGGKPGIGGAAGSAGTGGAGGMPGAGGSAGQGGAGGPGGFGGNGGDPVACTQSVSTPYGTMEIPRLDFVNPGKPGPNGPSGDPGHMGAAGSSGSKGPDGVPGDRGNDGDDSTEGPEGAEGLVSKEQRPTD